MRSCILAFLVLLGPASAAAAPPRALFDNTRAETAGNADWIIDTDQPLPIPDQSTVGPATPRTYWLGAISSYGIDLVKRGYQVATLTPAYGITYGNLANDYDLSKFDVFIVDEPNTRFTSAESTAVYQYVANGGGLIAISDHDVSDRNGDGWDSPHIWNALGIGSSWGIRCAVSPDAVSLANFTQDSGNQTNDTSDPVIYGPEGVADSLSFHNGTSFFIDPAVNPTVRGLFWKQGVAQTSTSQIMAARLQYGAGRIVFIGDSSPVDDGSAQPGNSSIFDGWGEAAGRDSILLLNATRWATRTPAPTAVSPASPGTRFDRAAPNPARGTQELRFTLAAAGEARLEIVDVTGRRVWSSGRAWRAAGEQRFTWDGRDLAGRPVADGLYFARWITPGGERRLRLARLR